ncbi:MAG TPA: hypothetical protein PKA37_04470 [Planctomycetota bacterium]|nr:hypothetical protein [Planctomycetota bacterium]
MSEDLFLASLRQRVVLLSPVTASLPGIQQRGDVAKRAFSEICDAAARFGAFLDDSRARMNRTFAPLSEFTSSLRGFAKIGRHLSHLEPRVGDLFPLPAGDEGKAFQKDLKETVQFVRKAVRKFEEAVRKELKTLLGAEPADHGRDAPLENAPLTGTALLPDSLEEGSVSDQERRIAELASKFLGHRRILKRQSQQKRFIVPDEMSKFVLEVSDEQEVRFFETRIHTLLSRYDTYVEGTPIEDKDPELKRFRRLTDVMHKLLQSMVELVHFYERHENDIRCEAAKNRIATIIDKREVLDRILNFNLYYLHSYVDLAAPLAESLVERYTKQTRVTLPIPEGVYLHARPVSLITRVVAHHGTPVNMTLGDVTCYAGSIINVLMAVGAHVSTREVTFEGDSAPLGDLRLLFESRLGEGPDPLPSTLSYLGLKS